MENICVPVSPGELLDKITILEIKAQQISDAEKLRNVETELKLLTRVWQQASLDDTKVQSFKQALKTVNQDLWMIEDKLRIKEAEKEFGQEFIDLARSVYVQNDKRAAIKKEINALLGSTIVEEKSYARYQTPPI
ncbi:MAG: DUF6165 family protein [Gammaproteobacteria bacterium]|nr:DUF6165 family protein [Gammaproteobacteria bacterium]